MAGNDDLTITPGDPLGTKAPPVLTPQRPSLRSPPPVAVAPPARPTARPSVRVEPAPPARTVTVPAAPPSPPNRKPPPEGYPPAPVPPKHINDPPTMPPQAAPRVAANPDAYADATEIDVSGGSGVPFGAPTRDAGGVNTAGVVEEPRGGPGVYLPDMPAMPMGDTMDPVDYGQQAAALRPSGATIHTTRHVDGPLQEGGRVYEQAGMKHDPLVFERESPVHRTPSFRATRTRSETDAQYTRIDLPSNFVPYEWKAMSIRRFGSEDLIRINRALSANSYSMLLDAVGATIDRDARDLTNSDMQFVMIYHRLESYEQTPYDIPWTSKYGNDCVATLKRGDLREVRMEMTDAEYADWRAKGFRIPTINEIEIAREMKLEGSSGWEYERASWLDYEYWGIQATPKDPYAIGSAIEALGKIGVSGLESIRTLRQRSAHGYIEQIQVRDEHFDMDKRINQLRDAIEMVDKLEQQGTNLTLLTEMLTEFANLTQAKQEGRKVEADEETVSIDFDASRFLTGL